MSLAEAAKNQASEFIELAKPASMNDNFGFDRQSVAYLDAFIDRQTKPARRDESLRAQFVSLLGSYLGEAILATYGGEWVELDGGLVIHIQRGDEVIMLQPFGKVHDRIMNGNEDNIEFYFAEFIPKTLAGEAPPEWKVAEYQADPPKPWWKLW
jgi:hypothetical protein